MPEQPHEKPNILLVVAGVLIALWLIGFIAHVAGELIHLVLVVALIIIVYRYYTGQNRPRL